MSIAMRIDRSAALYVSIPAFNASLAFSISFLYSFRTSFIIPSSASAFLTDAAFFFGPNRSSSSSELSS